MGTNTAGTAYTKTQAKQHDAKLAEATKALHAAVDRAHQAANDIHHAAGDKKNYRRSRQGSWTMTFAEAAETAQSIAAGHLELLEPTSAGNRERAPQRAAHALKAHQAATQAVTAARALVEQLEEVWRTHGRWSRFFVVAGGHIHRSTACHSLRITTKIGWLPELSGESEAEAVAQFGSVLCSKCFPSAPVEWTTQAPEPPDPSLCPGSGEYVPGANLRLYSPRGTCPKCGRYVSVTSLAKARKHKRPETAAPAEKLEQRPR